MHKIQRVSKLFRILFQIAFLLLPLLVIATWIFAPITAPSIDWQHGWHSNYLPMLAELIHLPVNTKLILNPLTVSTRLIGFVINLIPLSIKLFITYFLIKLFRAYEQGQIFTYHNVKLLRQIGITLLISQLIHILYSAVISVVLTWHNPPHHRFLAITFGSTNLNMIIIAWLIFLVSWIMAEAYQLSEEQQLTI